MGAGTAFSLEASLTWQSCCDGCRLLTVCVCQVLVRALQSLVNFACFGCALLALRIALEACEARHVLHQPHKDL
jgi:hypothetical protein